MIRSIAFALSLLPGLALADGGLQVTNPMIPLAPPGVTAHAAFFSLENSGDQPVSLVGASAEGYAMAHIHRSEEKDGVATMSVVHMLEVAPDQTVEFEHGGLHIMLMRPDGARAAGDVVSIELQFSDGTTLLFDAPVMPKSHGHGHDHGHAHGS